VGSEGLEVKKDEKVKRAGSQEGAMEAMRRSLLYISVLFMMVAPVTAWAQKGDERDPFYPSARRPAPQAQQQSEADWGRDPFDRPFSGPPAGQARVPQQQGSASGGLTGIIYSKNVRLAIIGGEVLHEGSMVGDRRLVDIRKKSVVLMTAAGGREEMFLEDFSLGR
jgi:hypothetical protein